MIVRLGLRMRPASLLALAAASMAACAGGAAAPAFAQDTSPGANPTVGPVGPAQGPGTASTSSTPTAGGTTAPGAPAPITAPSMPLQTPEEQAHWNDIQTAINKSEFKNAESLLRKWLLTHPDDRKAQFLLAYEVMFQGRNDDAINQFNTLLQADPTNTDYLFGKAKALVRAGRPKEAIPLLEQVRTTAPQPQAVYELEVEAARKANDTATLNTVLADAQQRYPAVNWSNIGVATTPSTITYPWMAQIGYTHDFLDNGFADWNALYASLSYSLTNRENVYGSFESADRFHLHDNNFTAGINYPLSNRLSSLLEVSASPTHHIVPSFSILGQLGYGLGDGWGIIGGERHSTYTDVTTDTQYLTLEKYLDLARGFWNYRVAYTFGLNEANNGGGTSTSNGVQLNKYYGDGRST